MTLLKPSSPAERMSDYDLLPPDIRQALASAAFPYDPGDIRKRLDKGRRAETILRGIEAVERKRSA